MSLILEALRKSEAERRRGQAPGLHVELPPTHASRAAVPPAWAWWVLAGALLFAAAWFVRGRLAQPPVVEAPAAATPAVAATPARLPDTQPRFRATPATPAHATPAPSSATQANPGIAGRSPRLPTAATVVAAEPPAAPAPAARARAPAPPVPVMPAPSTPADTVLRLSDLSAEERKSLPPLKLSMHLWNPDPARRFAILDGNRVGEGDRIGDAVVAAITTDGVELVWNGRRLLVPIR